MVRKEVSFDCKNIWILKFLHIDTRGDVTDQQTNKVMKDDSESVGLQKRDEDSKQQNTDKVKSVMEGGTGMQTSQSMLSSMLEGSEDEESKRRQDAKKKSKDEPKGLTETEKNKMVDIELCETETMTMLFMPGTIVVDVESDGMKTTEEYKKLLQYKVGADSYNNRGVQTLNLTQKSKDIAPDKIFMLKDENYQINNYEIEEENRKEREDEGTLMVREYEKSIDLIMNDKLSDPRALIDSEELASHISIYSQTTTQNGKVPGNKSGSKSGASRSSNKRNPSSKQEGESTSKSIVKASDTKSGLSDKLSSSSNTQQQMGITSKTSGLPDSTIPNQINYVESEKTFDQESMLKAIKIIERLLTQTKYHEEHVLYTDYPLVKIADFSNTEEEKKDEKQGGLRRLDFGNMDNQDDQKKEESDDEEEKLKADPEAIWVKPLFKYQCDLTDGRNITCMDFNKTNPDLLAVAYGEYDMNQTTGKNKGMIAFWTLKNPNFPERIIHTEHSVTAIEFSKLSPNIIA